MNYVNLGKSGLKVSRICLGTMTFGTNQWRPWVLNEPECRHFFQRAWDQGITFFDTADVYSEGASEEITGRALKHLGVTRDRFVLATKVGMPMGKLANQKGLSRKRILQSCDDSLRRLGVDYIDLYQIHRWDGETPIEETLRALDDLVRAGKVVYLGASSMYAWQFAKMLFAADEIGARRFVSMQNHYNLIYREEEREMIPLCRDQGVAVNPWSPLARGFLTGLRRKQDFGDSQRAKTDDFAKDRYFQDNDFQVVENLVALSQRRGDATPAELAYAWLMHKAGVCSVAIGPTKVEQIDSSCGAVDLKLSAEELQFLEARYQTHAIAGH
jgi:1-deoxyxylulose-5-phosphate synthase